MHQKSPLIVASEMIAQFGANAELFAGDKMEGALEAGDSDSFQHWSLVAKAVALFTRYNLPVMTTQSAALTIHNRERHIDDTTVRQTKRAQH